MIQPWLGEVTEALHGSKDQRTAINGKIREIRSLSGGLRSMEMGGFTFIMQNPSKNSFWAKLAREGKRVTQVKHENQWYGVIVNNEVLKYQKEGKDPIIIGDLITDCGPVQPLPKIKATVKLIQHFRTKPFSW